jgi:calcium-translocating P-type ATPase
VVNGAFAFVQEHRAERASERLRRLLPTTVTVIRDGLAQPVPGDRVVVGDTVVLSAGDRVVADLVAIESHDLTVDASTLTGESEPVPVGGGEEVFAGTFVVAGEGVAEAVRIAGDTRLADIATMTSAAHRPPGPLEMELRRVVRIVAVITLGAGAACFGLTRLTGMSLRDGFLFAVGVTVALVPEGLLPTLTLSLSMGAQRMVERDALVRHLQAVETLGSTTFVCTDKTGTLTQNRMAVVEVWTPRGVVSVIGNGYEPDAVVSGDGAAVGAATSAALAALASSRGRAVEEDGEWVAVGDPMEAAIDVLGRRLAHDQPDPPPVDRWFAFDPVRRRSSVICGGVLWCKGAPDSVLPVCADGPDGDAARTAVDDLAARGLRVLAVATGRPRDPIDAEAAESDLQLLGLLAFQDPPRPEVHDAVRSCRSAGVAVGVVTGDHPATALAIARQVGVSGADSLVVTGDELPNDDELGELLDRDGFVVSRATPEHKYRIAGALQARGHVVAMTGDGVNDGPALRRADIGVAMGRSGTDVAREAADLVLLDDDFATIVAAIEEGRATYTNIRRFLTYHLTDNVAELTPFVLWGLTGGQLPLAIGVLQVLCLDIVTDLLPALALGAEPPSPGLLDRPLTGRHLVDRSLLARVFGVLGPTEAAVEMLAFLVGLAVVGWSWSGGPPDQAGLAAASGAAFAAVVLGQVANAQVCRSATRPPWRLGWWSNRLLVWGLGLQVMLLAGFLLVPPVASVLGQAFPAWPAAVVALAAIPAVLAVNSLHLWVRRRARSARR